MREDGRRGQSEPAPSSTEYILFFLFLGPHFKLPQSVGVLRAPCHPPFRSVSPGSRIPAVRSSFSRSPTRELSFFSLLMSGLLSSLPLIGTLLASLWMPFASVLTGFAARDVLAGRTPVYFTLIAIFRDKASRWPLLAVGILASIWMELDMLVFQMMGQADLAQWKITAEGVDVESIAAHFPAGAFLTAFALYLPLLLMTLFAPLLIVQNRQSVIKSLFYSFFGTLRSLVPCLVWLVCVAALAFVIFLTIESISIAAGGLMFFTFMAPILIALISAVCQAGIWVMFRDIFASSRPDGVMPTDLDSDQAPPANGI